MTRSSTPRGTRGSQYRRPGRGALRLRGGWAWVFMLVFGALPVLAGVAGLLLHLSTESLDPGRIALHIFGVVIGGLLVQDTSTRYILVYDWARELVPSQSVEGIDSSGQPPDSTDAGSESAPTPPGVESVLEFVGLHLQHFWTEGKDPSGPSREVRCCLRSLGAHLRNHLRGEVRIRSINRVSGLGVTMLSAERMRAWESGRLVACVDRVGRRLIPAVAIVFGLFMVWVGLFSGEPWCPPHEGQANRRISEWLCLLSLVPMVGVCLVSVDYLTSRTSATHVLEGLRTQVLGDWLPSGALVLRRPDGKLVALQTPDDVVRIEMHQEDRGELLHIAFQDGSDVLIEWSAEQCDLSLFLLAALAKNLSPASG